MPHLKDTIAIFISFLALCFSIVSWQSNKQLAENTNVNERLNAYLIRYGEFISNNPNSDKPFSLETYDKNPVSYRKNVDVVFILLVSVVDAMNDAGDSRSVYWTRYLKEIPGPLLDKESLNYAGNGITKRAIEQYRKDIFKDRVKN